jgi:Na+-transporting methylmalonyl-CoA/oxaloacetate decarboxylase gamma subunit
MADENGGLKGSSSEVEKLRAENEALKAQVDKKAKRQVKGGFWRRFTVWLLIILACVFSLLGVFSTWIRATTLDTNTFVNTVAPLVKSEAVAKAVTDVAVTQLFEQYDVKGHLRNGLTQLDSAIRQALPPNAPIPDISLGAIADPVSSGLESVAKTAAQKILTSDAFFKIWESSLKLAHQSAINIIRGNKNAAVTSVGDKVVLNISPLLDKIKAQLVASGLTFLDKVQVPANIGQFELFTAKQLGSVKSIVKLLDLLYWLLPLLALLCFVGAVCLSKNKRRALIRSGVGLVIVMLLVLIVLKVAHSQLFNQIKVPENLAAADVVWGSLLGGLKQAIWGILVLGAVVSIGAGFAGPSKWAVWTREHVSDFFKHWRERREGEAGKSEFSAFLDKYSWWFRIGGLVVAVLVLVLIPHISALAIILTVVILAIYMALIELLR